MPEDELVQPEEEVVLPIDSTQVHSMDSAQMQVGIVDTKIQLITRTYGDSIVLRWAVEDYATWRYLCRVGVDVLRYSSADQLDADTIATRLRPLTLEQFRQRYPQTDSLAWLAAGMLYDKNGLKPTATKNPAGTLGSLYEIYQEQQMRLGYAILASEWRRDLADALAMRAVDRTAKSGQTYEYMVRPSQVDTTGQFIIRTAHIPELKNEHYKPEPLTATLSDSLITENTIQLWWPRDHYSSYEMERRKNGETTWQRVSNQPIAILSSPYGNTEDPTAAETTSEAAGRGSYVDRVPSTGIYEYRLRAHDAFGDLTDPSPVHVVNVRDITPPKAPDITLIVIDRRDPEDLSKGVYATFYFRKDTMEADYVGFYPVYFHEKITKGEWQRFSDQMLSPTDTTLTIDVTGYSTGMVAAAAVDTAGNVGYSMAKMIRLVDVRPPGVPQNLKATTNTKTDEEGNMMGSITLTWEMPEGDDDISSYEILFANDSTHRFVLASEDRITECRFVDTVDVTANQKYIYYKVRAIDYSSNIGPESPLLQVIRPTLIPPVAAHIDSSMVDDRGVHQVWVVSDEHFVARHLVYRKLEREEKWTLLRVCDADSLNALGNKLRFDDVPPYNREDRYLYAIESVSYSQVSTTSLAVSVRWEGDALFDFPIRLLGDYIEKEKGTRLVWEIDGVPPYAGTWYYCVYRQGEKDSRPKFLMSVKPDERSHSDWLLRPGEQATYYVKIKYKDGRESRPSNTVTVKRAKE